MKKEVKDIESYIFKREDKLFFDTNIWMFLFGRRTAIITDQEKTVENHQQSSGPAT